MSTFISETDCLDRLATQKGELARRAHVINTQRRELERLEYKLELAANRLEATIERCAFLLTAAVTPPSRGGG